jgi:UDP-N-acetylmuramoyl-L-alanyl-D-glutamate--2,6-diaminopimelate ligase
MADDGARAAMVEVSSHALDMHRTTGTAFRVVALTNFERDHLDWHRTLDAYRAAKARLFRRSDWELDPSAPPPGSVAAVLPTGTVGDWFARESDLEVTRYGESEGDWRIESVELSPYGGRGRLVGPAASIALDVRLPGRFNLRNAAVAAIACHHLGVEPQAIEAGLRDVPLVRGRMERVVAGQSFAVLIDYAHTPDALAAVLDACREFTAGRVICVIGAGGNRDRGKRPVMAETVLARADLAVFTSDNPRDEDPGAILDEMTRGLSARGEWMREPDRRAAVRLAVSHARPGDTVLVAGKGHETTQEISGRRIPMDDRELAKDALSALGFHVEER